MKLHWQVLGMFWALWGLAFIAGSEKVSGWHFVWLAVATVAVAVMDARDK